ncbi:antiviral innate immune response receptor RIG-I-like [Diadema antillarum]|uniref:antiviral innate immune response receptor RIG-I-like n=1 Tax=Diadema antillarum TaxID=105358 RepID=UPI003A846421
MAAIRGKVLRGYQRELTGPGLKGFNYIICAPTGSGKTHTAAWLCHRRMRETEAEGKRFKALFIVPTRHLKSQQRDAFLDLFDQSAAIIVTKTQQFRKNFEHPQTKALMITAQILVNAIREGNFTFQELSMLVFDECHHTTLNHPYNEIMREYILEKKRLIDQDKKKRGSWLVGRPFGRLPQIIGLTASVGMGGSKDAVQHIIDLCANLDCSGVKTVTEEANQRELQSINNPPELDDIIATEPRRPSKVSSTFINLLKETMMEIEQNQLRRYLRVDITDKTPNYGSEDYQSWIGPVMANAREKQISGYLAVASYLFKLNLALMTYEDLPGRYVLLAMDKFLEQAREDFDSLREGKACRQTYEKRLPQLKRLAEIEHPLEIPKLKSLVQLLEKMFRQRADARGIILARTRFATTALLDFINHNINLSKYKVVLRATRVVGQGKAVEDAQTQAKQEAALQEFRTGRANVLVATDIVQEGLDVPACNFIIRYNFVSNEIGTVQAKGRARAIDSQCFLIVESNSLNEHREQKNRKKVRDIERALMRINSMEIEQWLGSVAQKQITILRELQRQELL